MRGGRACACPPPLFHLYNVDLFGRKGDAEMGGREAPTRSPSHSGARLREALHYAALHHDDGRRVKVSKHAGHERER